MTCHLLLNLSLEFGRSRSVCITERKNAASTEQIIMVRQTFTQVRQPLTFLKTLYEVGYLSWTWTFLLNTICEFERGWRHSFLMIPNAKKLRLHKTRFFGKSKASCRFTYIYVVILYAITGIFCMWTAILLLRTHIFFFHSQTYTRTFSNLHTTDCVQQYIKQISSGGSEFCLFASFGLVYSGMLCHSMKWDTKKRHSRISIIISNNFSNAYHHWNCIEKCSWAWETVFESSVIGTHFYLIFVTVEMLLLFIASPDCWEFFYFLGR